MTAQSTDLTRLSAATLAGKLASGEVSSVEVTTAHLDRIAAVDPAVHAFLHVNTADALATARDVDARRAAGETLPELAGVPIAVKDIVVTKGIPTTAGSRILEGWIPPYVGLAPTVPVTAAGCRIEPPVSVPMPSGARKPATAALEPPPEPPGVRVRSHGLWVGP